MSGAAKPLGEGLDGAAGQELGANSEVDEELRFHLDLLIEQLCGEGYERTDAEAEARRRFGDPDAIAEECITQRSGPLGIALHWLITSTASAWVVAAASVVAVVLTGDPPLALLFVLLPVALLAGACAALCALRPARSALTLRAGHRLLGLLVLLSLATFLFSSGNWNHSLWSVQFPLFGLLFGSGLLLVRVWRDDRCQYPDLLHGRNGATVALLTLLVLGSLTFALPWLRTGAHQQSPGAPVPALVEAVRYGFGGGVPSAMQPHGLQETERGLGVPSRIVTVTMGSSLFAALAWIVFVLLALVGRAIPAGTRRRSFFLFAPLLLASTSLLLQGRVLFEGLWGNEPWLVRAYGPTLLIAALATPVLFLLVRRDGGSEGRAS